MTTPPPLPPATVVAPEDLADAVVPMLRTGARLALVAAHHDHHAPDGIRIVHSYLTPGEPPAEIETTVPLTSDGITSLAQVSYTAGRFEREVRDLFGVPPIGHPLPRRLVRHGHWPTGYHPMRLEAAPEPAFDEDLGSFPFLEVTGDGVYEIPVGPVHAGLIEPGHFRFSVVGETILRMKARLWFVHRGVERLFHGRRPDDGVELAERISGDTAVGHTLAYVTAVEQALGIGCSTEEALLRDALLELERLHNHVADIGAIVNDVGYGIVHAQTQTQRERLLRHNREVTGHRLLRGAIHPGGCVLRALPDVDLVDDVAEQTASIVGLALSNHTVTDRLTGTSPLSIEDARRIGVLGYVAKASGLEIDARRDHPLHPHARPVQPVGYTAGDVLSRLLVRADEVQQSARLIRELVAASRHSPSTDAGRIGGGSGLGITGRGLGIVEAWRGTLVHRVEIREGVVTRCKVVDPSFFNWPALPVALKDTIVPDFPLTNKSFNQSYAGNDL
ncbi:MAG: nickel-dependent hydrogenase large subunit [Actinomycetales bacterium]